MGHLELYYSKLQKWHDFLHKRAIPKCIGSPHHSESAQVKPKPCLTVHHPWETEVELDSPLWNYALKNVTDLGWSPKYSVPNAVKTSFDYPGDETYNTLLFLLDCLSENSNYEQKQSTLDTFQPACPFEMIDVGFAAALSKGDKDLMQIGQILFDKNKIKQPSWYATQMAQDRAHVSKQMLHHTWDDEKGIFFNHVVNLTLNSNGTYVSNLTTPVELPIASYFAALWDPLSNSTKLERMSSKLLQRSGQFSFNCGDYPLGSIGGCEVTESQLVVFLLNYRVSKGLQRNNEVGLAHFLRDSSLNLLCGLPNSEDSNLTDCRESQHLAAAFNATSLMPVGAGECDLTCTLTAAIVLDMMAPDKAFRYDSEPPISSSSVIFLIAVELAVAFGVGVICLLLSLNLMRRASADEEGDAFVQIIEEQQTEEELLLRSPVEAPDDHETAND